MRFSEFFNFWKNKAIIDIGKVITGNTPPTKNSSYYGDSFNWAGPSDLGMSKYINDTKVKLSNDGMLVSRVIPKNSILVTCIGSTIGKMGISTKAMATNQQINSIIVNTKFNFEFIYYEILYSFKKYLKTVEVQAVPIISKSAFEKLKIYVPSIDEQRKLAKFLTLIDQRIDTQSKIIEKYKSLINTIRTNVFSSFQGKWTKLCDLVENKSLQLNRGNIIPKHPKDDVYKYPVYSSSVQKDGLMGYSDYYMFDKELITWSIDGGGDIFFREKHKFCVTNVCGILQLDTNKFSYRFVAEALKYQHSKMTFDYQTKAHPSVIEKLYSLPDIELNEQNKYSKLFEVLYFKLRNEQKYLEIIKEQKKYLLSNMFI